MSDFLSRFQEEVDRIGGVTAISGVLGVARNTVYNWKEKGNVPLGNLYGLVAALGLDAHYVITGHRDASKLSVEESELVSRYRDASLDTRHAVLGALLGVRSPRVGGVGEQRLQGDGNVQIGYVGGDVASVRGRTKKPKP